MDYRYDYPRPAVATDLFVFRRDATGRLLILLIKRRNSPFAGQWALPGGFLDENETLEESAIRELREETGLTCCISRLIQLQAYSAVDRDPRTRVISIVFLVPWDASPSVCAGDDAGDARWFPVDELPALAFDHDRIIGDGLKFIRDHLA